MIKIDKTEVVGFEHAIRGMRNPLNSWDKSDSYWTNIEDEETMEVAPYQFFVGDNDFDLMNRLSAAGNDHSKFLRMIVIYTDIVAPMYWWKEFDTYKVGTVRNSCSTMHKIHSKEFTMDDFSVERMDETYLDTVEQIIDDLNLARSMYDLTKDKAFWETMIQLLPSSYNQKSTVMLNYQVLKNIYHSRRHHKLDEWHTFCDWIESLPYSELITGSRTDDPCEDDLK